MPPPTTRMTPSTTVARMRLSARFNRGGESSTMNLYSLEASRISAGMYSDESKSAGFGGIGPLGRTEGPIGAVWESWMGQQAAPVGIPGQEINETGSVGNAEEIMEAGTAQVRVDEQNFFSQLRERDSEISGDGGLTFATFGAGDQQSFG